MKHFISNIQKEVNNRTNSSGLSAENTTPKEVLPYSARKEIRKDLYLHELPGPSPSRSTRKSSLNFSRNSEKKIIENKPRSSNTTAVKRETTKNNKYETSRRGVIRTGTGTGPGTSTGSTSSPNNIPQPRDAINVNVHANVSTLQVNPGLRIIRRRYQQQPAPAPVPGPLPAAQARQLHVLIEFICNICGKRQSSLVALFEHIHDHTGFKPFLCHLCPKKYVRIECLRRHEKTHKKKGRDGRSDPKIGCPICQLKFSWSSGLYNHVRKIHKGNFSI